MKKDNNNKKNVFVLMSGGVDSSVAALLLKRAGYKAIGITLNLWPPESKGCLKSGDLNHSNCCGADSVLDAKLVAKQIGIKHRALDFRKIFYKKVVKKFLDNYIKGKTPNPCVLCNQYVKFDEFLKWAKNNGGDYIATGHYVKLEYRIKNLEYRKKLDNKKLNSKYYILYSARDAQKDQSYFLWTLNQNYLKYCLFPLGNYTKKEVRGIAAKAGLPVADKKESQDICFIPNGDLRGFIKEQTGADDFSVNKRGRQKQINAVRGKILNIGKEILGEHKGIAFYTVGQRRGLDIPGKKPYYVIKIDAENNNIIVGNKNDCFVKKFPVKNINWIHKKPKIGAKIMVKIRSQNKLIAAKIIFSDNKIKIKSIKEKFRAPAPGQSAVFYGRKGEMLGGGIIKKFR